MKNLLSRFIRATRAATAIEYGLIAGLIAVATITAITSVGTSISSTFLHLATTVATP
jgi:pilus assembly protein Flp/PilA